MNNSKKAAGFHQATFNKFNCNKKSYKTHFNRSKMPSPIDFYLREIGKLTFHGEQATGTCPFHDDSHPSLSINLETGCFHCFSCGASGGNVIDFFMQKNHFDFKTAAQALNAWEN